MKNRHTAILVLITCMFVSFSLGFLSGRATAPGDTIVTQVSAQTRATAPASETRPAENTVSILPTVTEPAASVPATTVTKPAATEVPSAPAEVVEETAAVPPTVAEESASVSPATTATQPRETKNTALININTATLAQLDTLPGIGPVIAQRIIDYREAHGPFTSVSQLIYVDGIGEKRLAAIIDLVTI